MKPTAQGSLKFTAPVAIAPDLNSATLPVHVATEGDAALAEISLLDPDGAQITSATVPLDNGSAAHTVTLDRPRLWWPNGYGAQLLYRLVVTPRDVSNNPTGVTLLTCTQNDAKRLVSMIILKANHKQLQQEEYLSDYSRSCHAFKNGNHWIGSPTWLYNAVRPMFTSHP